MGEERESSAGRGILKKSGGFTLILREHLAGKSKHLFGHKGAGQEADAIRRIIAIDLVGITQDQNRERRHAGVQFGDEGRSANASEVVSGDNHSEAVSELGLLHQAEGFCRAGNTKHICESFLQYGLSHKGLKRVVVNQENLQYNTPEPALPSDRARQPTAICWLG
jgi:hypothetical protein